MKSITQIRGNIHVIEFDETWGPDFYLYQGDTLIRVCPSMGMAREISAGL